MKQIVSNRIVISLFDNYAQLTRMKVTSGAGIGIAGKSSTDTGCDGNVAGKAKMGTTLLQRNMAPQLITLLTNVCSVIAQGANTGR
jgi:hypothetical protein